MPDKGVDPQQPISSGAKANKTGSNLEALVGGTLERHDYIHNKTYKSYTPDLPPLGQKVYATQVYVGESIYGSKRKIDFLVFGAGRHPVFGIECKWQQKPGSVDEKYPFLVHNIAKTMLPTIVILDGGGYKPAARLWMQEQVKSQEYLIAVYDIAEFQQIVNNGFLD